MQGLVGLSGGQGGNDVCYQKGEADGGGGQDGPESYQHANFLNKRSLAK